MSIRELHRFRYSSTSDLAIGRDEDGKLWYQQWRPLVVDGLPVPGGFVPCGWVAYDIHHGLEEAEELLRLTPLTSLLISERWDGEKWDACLRRLLTELCEHREAASAALEAALAGQPEPQACTPPNRIDPAIVAGAEVDALIFPEARDGETPASALRRLLSELRERRAGVDVAEVREVARLLVEGLPDEQCLSLTEMSNRLTAALGGAGEAAETGPPHAPDSPGRSVKPPRVEPAPRIDEVYVLGQQWLSSGESERETVGFLPPSPAEVAIYEQEHAQADQRHRDLVELAAAFGGGMCANPDWPSEVAIVPLCTAMAGEVLAAIDAAEKDQEA